VGTAVARLKELAPYDGRERKEIQTMYTHLTRNPHSRTQQHNGRDSESFDVRLDGIVSSKPWSIFSRNDNAPVNTVNKGKDIQERPCTRQGGIDPGSAKKLPEQSIRR